MAQYSTLYDIHQAANFPAGGAVRLLSEQSYPADQHHLQYSIV